MDEKHNFSSSTQTHFTLIIAIIAILLAAVSTIVSVSLWRHQPRANNTAQVSALQNAVDSENSEVNNLNEEVRKTNQAITDLSQLDAKSPRNFILAEVAYLIKLANYNLTFEKNSAAAVMLLSRAENIIAQVRDSSLLELRQALKQDELALQATPSLDLTDLVVAINALSQELDKLTPLPERPAQPLAQPIPVSQATGWRKHLDTALAQLNSLVVVHRLKTPALPLLPPSAHAYLIENLRLQLAQAQWAALNHNDILYQQALTQANTWIENYFQPNDAVTVSVLANIKKLAQTNVNPPLPTLIDSLKALSAAMTLSIQQQHNAPLKNGKTATS